VSPPVNQKADVHQSSFMYLIENLPDIAIQRPRVGAYVNLSFRPALHLYAEGACKFVPPNSIVAKEYISIAQDRHDHRVFSHCMRQRNWPEDFGKSALTPP
jgi:hypothetical protein